MQGLIYNSPYTKSYKTSTNSRILTLHRKDWENLLKHFPNSKKHIYKYLKDDGFDDDDDDNGSGSEKKQVKLVTNGENSPSIPDKLPPQQSDVPQAEKIEDVDFKKGYPDILPPGTSRDYDNTSSMEKLEVAPLEETAIIESSSSDSSTYDVEAKRATSHFDVESMNDDLIKTTVKDLRKRDLRLENIDDLTDSDYIGDSDKSLTRDNKETSQRNTKKYKSLVEMESVEDYIANKRSKSRKSSLDAKLVPIKEILPPNFKKRKHHVVIKESDSDIPPVESHELKPILNTDTDKRNLKSLDSDMETTVKVEDAKSSKDSLSDDRSVE